MIGALLPSRGAFDRVRAAVADQRRLYEIRGDGLRAEWAAVDTATPFEWHHARPLVSAKRFFFPERERLVAWDDDDVARIVEPEPAPFALVGVHPCDVAAIGYLDRFFAEDPWYARRRARAFLVALNCVGACAGGFCLDVGAGPFAGARFDLAVTPLPDGRVLLEIGTDAGRDVLDGAGIRIDDVPDGVRLDAETRAKATFPPRPFIARAIARIDAGRVTDAEWHALGPACFACTGCTSLCPTCSCFTTMDASRNGGGERVREWDSCLLEGFQREASGHNPAPHAGDRVRRFWTHKLEHTFASQLGRLGCVGCGRCDVTCPGSIGALRVLRALGDE
jgi:formate hydrogenlyase subunit 6/NADH:ubiquinone oxidoreductase subunit I